MGLPWLDRPQNAGEWRQPASVGVWGKEEGGDDDGAGEGRKLSYDEGRRKACAHLREGACCELQFLLKQGTQHLVLLFQVKHPLLQLDALLPKVLPPPRRREEKETAAGK